MTDTPKKPGRPRKATAQPATTPQDSPAAESKSDSGTQVPAEPEIDAQRLAQLPTITVEELIQGMDEDLVRRVDVAMARHMVKEHRMSWGEARTSLGYGVPGRDPQRDELWDTIYGMAQ